MPLVSYHSYKVSIVDADGLVHEHQNISSHNAD